MVMVYATRDRPMTMLKKIGKGPGFAGCSDGAAWVRKHAIIVMIKNGAKWSNDGQSLSEVGTKIERVYK